MNPSAVPRLATALALAALVPLAASAQSLASFEKRTTVKTLANGLTVVVCERHEAPTFSFFTHVDVGGVQEVDGITGIAHMFEHMAFKGTDTIGTKDFTAESAALAKVEDAYAAWRAERQSPKPDAARLAALEKAFKDAVAAADSHVVGNEFDEILSKNGAVGVNAFTSHDETGYFYSLPANRFELWAYLESERFLKPVFREFYKERDVVMEERRMRSESNPFGRLFEQFVGAAFIAHPYRRPVVGWMSDLESFSATDAKAFYETHYVPANMVVTVVGDVRAADALAVIERYFGRLPKRPRPAPLATVEPVQIAERSVRLYETAQPVYLEGYHRPSALHPDEEVYSALSDILSNGRVSRLYRSLVRDKKVAARVAGFSGFPGDRYPNLFAFFGIPTPDHTLEEVRDGIHAEIERLKSEDVTDEELRLVKTRAKADLIRRLGDNEGLAYQLGASQARFGDWRELFRSVERIEKVTKADIRRVANEVFVHENRTVGEIVTEKPAEPAGAPEKPAAAKAPAAGKEK